jgi:predicted nucleic acid-binding protein
MLFIDANQFLRLYVARRPETDSVLKLLIQVKDHIFLPRQVVQEVNRKKLNLVAKDLAERIAHWEKSRNLDDQLPKLIDRGKSAGQELLREISQSADEVSKALEPLFSQAVEATDDEWQRARLRKERGNPPGKQNQPLGDQLSWEQFLSHAKGKKKVWIITDDGDFALKLEGVRFLNALLCQDLAAGNDHQPVSVFCFDDLFKGIKHLIGECHLPKTDLPTGEEEKRIESELDKAADVVQEQENLAALLRGMAQRRLMEALVATEYYEAHSMEGAYHAAQAHAQQQRRNLAAVLHAQSLGQQDELPPQGMPFHPPDPPE